MRRVSSVILATLLLLLNVTPALAHSVISLPPGPMPTLPEVKSYKVSLGRQTLDGTAVLHNQVFPGTIYVNEGETVTFVNESMAPHTVTFLGDRDPKTLTEPELVAPTRPSGAAYTGGFFSSGILEFTQPFALSFSKVGIYNFICALHPGMGGTVVVLPKGTPVPSAEQQAAADQAAFAHNAHVGHVLDTAAKQAPARVHNADGTTTWTVNMGASGNMAETMAFYPSTLRIRVGDTVQFHLDTQMEAHSASVNRPENVYLFGDGPLGLNPVLFAPAGDGTVDGNAEFDGTGLVLPGMPDAKLVFTKAGVYHIHCDLHDALGMTMTITVVEKDAVDLFLGDKLVEDAQLKNGVIFAPVRAVADLLGAKLTWNAAAGVATVTTDGQEHHCHDCGSARVVVNGQPLAAGDLVFIENGRMYAPAVAWAAILGGTTQYDADAGVLRLSLQAAK